MLNYPDIYQHHGSVMCFSFDSNWSESLKSTESFSQAVYPCWPHGIPHGSISGSFLPNTDKTHRWCLTISPTICGFSMFFPTWKPCRIRDLSNQLPVKLPGFSCQGGAPVRCIAFSWFVFVAEKTWFMVDITNINELVFMGIMIMMVYKPTFTSLFHGL